MKKILNHLLLPFKVQLYNERDINNIIAESQIVYDYGSIEAYELEMARQHQRDLEEAQNTFYEEAQEHDSLLT
jgi:hypothetical protein